MLALEAGAERRYLLVDAALAVNAPALGVVRRGAGASLLMTDARGLYHHADSWVVHLIEDDGDGPRLALRRVLVTCGGDELGFGCGTLVTRGRYLRGDAELVLAYRGDEGFHRTKTFRRRAPGAPPAPEPTPDDDDHGEPALPPFGIFDPAP